MATPDRPDPDLIRAAQGGDLDAFELLVQRHAVGVGAALRSFGLTPDESDEVAQEVFLRAWRGLSRFEGRAQLSTWLYRIAYNEAQRRISRRPPLPAAPTPDGDDPLDRVEAAASAGPEAQALERDFQRALDAALATLPEDWRRAVVLRDLEGFSTEEAAAAAGLGEAAFKSRLHRGRMQLRAALEPYLQA